MIINPDFKEFIQLLNENKVDYLIIGGYALAFHGYPRFTQDIDFWVWADAENAKRITKVLDEFGFTSLEINEYDFLDEDSMIQLGFPPNRIDIINQIDGVNFLEAFSEKEIFEDGEIRINFIGLDQLIQNKKASGRLKDLADVQTLEEIRRDRDNKR